MWALKSLVSNSGIGSEKFQKKYGTLFRVTGVGISPTGSPTVDMLRLKPIKDIGNMQEKFEEYKSKITVEKMDDGIYVNGKYFAKEW